MKARLVFYLLFIFVALITSMTPSPAYAFARRHNDDLEDAADEAGDELHDAGHEIKDGLNEAGDKIEDKLD